MGQKETIINEPFKIMLVAGSRSIYQIEIVQACLDHFMAKYASRLGGVRIKVLHGDARGVDRLAGRWAFANNMPCDVMPADWKTHPRRAGYLRNEQMGKAADFAVIIYDGKSPGTRHMMNIMHKHERKHIFLYRQIGDTNEFNFVHIKPEAPQAFLDL